MVERETQKGIIIGHKGSAIKRVGAEARKDLEKFFEKKVFIELYVKVNKNWRSIKGSQWVWVAESATLEEMKTGTKKRFRLKTKFTDRLPRRNRMYPM